jgi:aminopeptidase YwaD
MKKLILCLLFLSSQSYSQDIKYARYVLDTLCSETMNGRGYVNKGERKAADFIVNEFKNTGLQTVNGKYEQLFSFPVNTFPGDMYLQIDDIVLKPGIDYLICMSSDQCGLFSINT